MPYAVWILRQKKSKSWLLKKIIRMIKKIIRMIFQNYNYNFLRL